MAWNETIGNHHRVTYWGGRFEDDARIEGPFHKCTSSVPLFIDVRKVPQVRLIESQLEFDSKGCWYRAERVKR
jgi:hypothetical protein